MNRTDLVRKGKPWVLCAVRGCKLETIYGRKEKDIRERLCARHHPKGKVQENVRKNLPSIKTTKKVGKCAYVGHLACVFRPYERTKDVLTGKDRYEFSDRICGKPCPRKQRKTDEPRWSNRFGEPLCDEHKIHRNDPLSFPSTESETAAELLLSDMKGRPPLPFLKEEERADMGEGFKVGQKVQIVNGTSKGCKATVLERLNVTADGVRLWLVNVTYVNDRIVRGDHLRVQ